MILPLEAQVSSLGLSNRLKELGVRQESMLWWYDDCRIVSGRPILEDYPDRYVSAWTVAELGELLPTFTSSYQNESAELKWWCGHGEYDQIADTEANARAKMLIHLIEQDLITVAMINRRFGK